MLKTLILILFAIDITIFAITGIVSLLSFGALSAHLIMKLLKKKSMKYLYLIIRHVFPRKRWKQVAESEVNRVYPDGTKIPDGWVVQLKDQFGNVKFVRFRA